MSIGFACILWKHLLLQSSLLLIQNVLHCLGAHGRFTVKDKNTGMWERQARIQTLEPEPWMWEVGRYGHATRRVVPQTTLDM